MDGVRSHTTIPTRGISEKAQKNGAWVFVFAGGLLFSSTVRAAPPVTAEFARVLPGAGAAALGNAGVADPNAPFAAAHNPALLSRSNTRWGLSGEQSLWLEDVRASHYGATYSATARRRWGFGFTYSQWGTEPFEATDSLGNSAGRVDFNARSIGVAVAHEPVSSVHVGVGIKSLSQGFTETAGGEHAASVMAADAGVLWDTPLPGLALGAAVRNAGGRLSFSETSEQLPTSAHAGLQGSHFNGLFRWRMEGSKAADERTGLNTGVEYRPFPLVGFRLGYDSLSGGAAPAGMTSGFSLGFQSLTVDYSLTPLGALGTVQRFTFAWRFGRVDAARLSARQEAHVPAATSVSADPDAIYKKWVAAWESKRTVREKPVVLVVDDQELALSWIVKSLEAQGYETISAATGAEALWHVEERQPDLVFLDQFIPGRSGAETLRAIKERAPFTPVVMMMWDDQGQDADAFRRQGARSVLAKPVNAERMKETLTILLPSRDDGPKESRKPAQRSVN
jgi:CheY-like chemotaxis protein